MAACTKGLHLPTKQGWKELFNYPGEPNAAGGKFKSKQL